MDARNEIRGFLVTRRARLKAAELGLPDSGRRRVPGPGTRSAEALGLLGSLAATPAA